MSALFASDIDNCYIEIDSEEPPVTDGSANVFLELLEKAGIKEQEKEADIITIDKVYRIEGNSYSTNYCLWKRSRSFT